MLITVAGSGYVGAIVSACLCEIGHDVVLLELDPEKFEVLQSRQYSIYEPGLMQMLAKHLDSGKLKYSQNIEESIRETKSIIVTVPTTKACGNDLDLSQLHNYLDQIALHLSDEHYTGIFIKTSVPVGSCSILLKNFQFARPDLQCGIDYDIIANPTVLREGSAIHDFMMPSRVLIGINNDSQKAKELIEEMYSVIKNLNTPFIYSNYETVELIRYATIGFVVTKMAYINEIATLCEYSGADIDAVMKGMTLDSRVASRSFEVSPVFGGTSYPRAARILQNIALTFGFDLETIKGTIKSNDKHIKRISKKAQELIGPSTEDDRKIIAVWGLSFKAQTSDIRESPSVKVIDDLLSNGYIVNAYDPAYIDLEKTINKLPYNIVSNRNFNLVESPYISAHGADIILIMTNWGDFAKLDYRKVHELMNKNKKQKPIILDNRNMLQQNVVQDFCYIRYGDYKQKQVESL